MQDRVCWSEAVFSPTEGSLRFRQRSEKTLASRDSHLAYHEQVLFFFLLKLKHSGHRRQRLHFPAGRHRRARSTRILRRHTAAAGKLIWKNPFLASESLRGAVKARVLSLLHRPPVSCPAASSVCVLSAAGDWSPTLCCFPPV